MISLIQKFCCFQLIVLALLLPSLAQAEYYKETADQRKVRVGLCTQRCFLTQKHCKYKVEEDPAFSVKEKKEKSEQCAVEHKKCDKGCDVDLFPAL